MSSPEIWFKIDFLLNQFVLVDNGM